VRAGPATKGRQGCRTPLIDFLQARGIAKYFPIHSGLLQRKVGQVRAVDGVDLDITRGETVGLVGESGCGKSTLGRILLRLTEPSAGEITFEGRDLLKLRSADLRKIRRDMQIVFQDPVGSLDPRMTVGQIIAEGLTIHGRGSTRQRSSKYGNSFNESVFGRRQRLATRTNSQADSGSGSELRARLYSDPSSWSLTNPSPLLTFRSSRRY